ncbi:hypothetical protein JRQ81_006441, partial [Phrynocephalus forsythii]
EEESIDITSILEGKETSQRKQKALTTFSSQLRINGWKTKHSTGIQDAPSPPGFCDFVVTPSFFNDLSSIARQGNGKGIGGCRWEAKCIPQHKRQEDGRSHANRRDSQTDPLGDDFACQAAAQEMSGISTVNNNPLRTRQSAQEGTSRLP